MELEFASLHAPKAFNNMLFGLLTVLQQYIFIFLNNSRLYFDDNRLTKISLPFIVISNGIAHPLVLLKTDFENSVILDSISKIKIIKTILRGPKLKFYKLRYLRIQNPTRSSQ